MWTQVLAAAAKAMNQLTESIEFVERDGAPRLYNPYITTDYVETLDVLKRTLGDNQGAFSAASFHAGGVNFGMGDGSVRMIMANLATEVVQAMRLGVNGEDWHAIPAVPLPDSVASAGGAFFNLRTLHILTDYYVADPEMKAKLLTQLGNVRAGAIEGYIGALQKVRGTYLSAVQADTLIRLAQAMQ
jgi:prepilin-type processing-associated H-X9-DG protein